MAKSKGHPGKTADPVVKLQRRVNDVMRQAVALTAEIQSADLEEVPEDILRHAQAGAGSLMAVYAWLTGLPAPWDLRAAEMGWDKV